MVFKMSIMKPVGNGIYVNQKWEFNEQVAKKFDLHIKKSIPLYEEGHNLILYSLSIYLSNYKKKLPVVITDLGCSTGALISKISKNFYNIPITFYGVDYEDSMLKIAKKKKFSQNHQIHWFQSKVEDFSFPFSNIFICYYTLQFIPLKKRKNIINNIYKKLYKNGLFFLFEKVKIHNKQLSKYYKHIIESFKLNSGYTIEEIKNKEESLKNILIPMTSEENLELLKEVGFKNYGIIFQYSYFEGILAIK